MNNSTFTLDTILREINEEKAHLLMPAIIYVSVLMGTGLIGNLLVCFYYGFKTKTTPSTIFIVSLGIYDITVCCIFMPTEIVDIVKFYTFDNNAACKVLRFVNLFTGLGSVLTLLAIAVDRYKHIPRSTGKQINLTQAKLTCVMIAMMAAFLSWPSILVYDSLYINIPNKYGLQLNGSNCMLTNQPTYKPYVWAFNIFQFVCFVVFTTVLVVLYGIVGNTIYKHRKRMSQYKLPGLSLSKKDQGLQSETISDASFPSNHGNIQNYENQVEQSDSGVDEPSCTMQTQESMTELVPTSLLEKHISIASINTEEVETCNHQEISSISYHDNDDTLKFRSSSTAEANKNLNNVESIMEQNVNQPVKAEPIIRRRPRTRDGIPFDRETIQITLVMIAVTGLFIVSMLPYLCLTVWRNFEGKHEAEFLSDQGLLAFKIASRSYLLNSSLNPWIYGVFNSNFRRYYYGKLCCKS